MARAHRRAERDRALRVRGLHHGDRHLHGAERSAFGAGTPRAELPDRLRARRGNGRRLLGARP